MPRSIVTDAIVLKTYDVGEADRYCIFFTRELGRVTARAAGVRRMTSRMGGTLLPCQVVQVHLKESSAGYIVAGVQHREGTALQFSDIRLFSQAQEGIELLLTLTQSDEPIEEVFDATADFLRHCGKQDHRVLAYTFQLLAYLGLLPEGEMMNTMTTLSDADHAFIGASLMGATELPPLSSPRQLQSLCRYLLRDHIHAPLKAAGVGAAMQG